MLTWSDNSEGELGFRIERQPGGAGWPKQVGPNERIFTDRPGIGEFRYRVAAVGKESASELSDQVSISVRAQVRENRQTTRLTNQRVEAGASPSTASTTPSGNEPSPALSTTPTLAMPLNLRCTFSIGWVQLNWTDRSEGETGYEIVRETYAGSTWADAQVFQVNANTQVWEDRTPAGIYRYRVRAAASGQFSPYSPWVIAAMMDGPQEATRTQIPLAPTSVSASDIGNGRVLVSWRDIATNEDAFEIERDPALPSGIVRANANSTAFLDTVGNGTFKYRVRAKNGAGVSNYSPWASVQVTSGTGGEGGTSPSSTPAGGSTTGGSVGGSVGGSTGGSGSGSGGGTGGAGSGGTSGGGSGGGASGGGTGGTGSGSGSGSGSGGTIQPTTGNLVYGSEFTPGRPIGPDGWTTFQLGAGARVIYVSSSMGDNNNSGLTENAPVRTISHALWLMRDGMGDWVLLKRGDTFRETVNWGKSGKSLMEPSVLGAYGDGPRPQIVTDSRIGIRVSPGTPKKHVAFVGLHIREETWQGQQLPEEPVGISWVSDGEDLLIEDCKIEGYGTNVYLQGFPGVLKNLKVRRNVLVDPKRPSPDNGSVNLYTAYYDGSLVEENVMDMSEATLAAGWHMSQHFYMGENQPSRNVVRRNIARNAGRCNLMTRSGGLIENNLSIRGAMGFALGIQNATNLPTGTFADNVVIESRNNSNGQPLGIGFFIAAGESATLVRNLIIHGTDGLDHRAIHIESAHVRSTLIQDNVIHDWIGSNSFGPGVQTLDIGADPIGMITITNNIVNQPGRARMVWLDNPAWPVQQFMRTSGNKFYSQTPANQWFARWSEDYSLDQWRPLASDTTSIAQAAQFPNPSVNIASYMSTLSTAPSGGSLRVQAAAEQLMQLARQQSRFNWRPDLNAAAINAHLRAGFGR